MHEILNRAETNRKDLAKQIILFIDEIDRSILMQDDELIRSVDAGPVTLIGATPQHPSFTIGLPLLRRCASLSVPFMNISPSWTCLEFDSQLARMDVDFEARLHCASLANVRVMLWTLETLIKSTLTDGGNDHC